MTRELLLQKICPNACINDCRFIGCAQCNVQLNEWLDEYDKQIRADAIDGFAKRLKAECRKCYVDCDPYGSGIEEDSILYEDEIYEIAKELKAGRWNK